MRLIDADALERELIEVANYRCKTHPKWEQPFRICNLIINRQPTISQWIPVSERLPQDNSDVLVCAEDGQVLIGWLDGENDWWICSELADDYKSVIAWMPLPEPYKEIEDD